MYFDEIYLLLRDSLSANFLYTSWKRFRKYNAYATGITQNVQDCLTNDTAYAMLANSEFVVMLRQTKDIDSVVELYGLSEPQRKYLLLAQPGEGIIKMGNSLISAMKFSAKHKKMRRKTALIYSEAERKEIERVYGVFKDYIHASKFLDFVWSEKLGYLLLHIDPTKNTIEEDQIITSADELCAELFNEVATDVFQEAKREHFYPDADDDEIAEIRRRWQPYLDLLPAYRSSCRAFHTAE